MASFDTMYSEKERTVTLTVLNNFNMNPFAFFGMIQSYVEKIHPLPVRGVYTYSDKEVEFSLYAVGNLASTRRGNPDKMDQVFLNLFLQSYTQNMAPLPIDFVFANAISIHLHTPGYNKKQKNPMRTVAPWFKEK